MRAVNASYLASPHELELILVRFQSLVHEFTEGAGMFAVNESGGFKSSEGRFYNRSACTYVSIYHGFSGNASISGNFLSFLCQLPNPPPTSVKHYTGA